MKKKIAFFMSTTLVFATVIGSVGTLKAKASNKHKASNKCSIEQIVSEMPLEKKVAQMLMPSFKSGVKELNEQQKEIITKYNFGGIILFADNVQNASQATKLVNSMQEANKLGGAKSSLFISIDQEGGNVSRLQTGTQMPGNMAIGATGDSNNAYRAAVVTGKELAVQGINVNFAPVMDVNNNPNNPVIGVRSFSDDPKVVAEFGSKYIEGLHKNDVMAALKHFPGHGDTSTDSHTGLPLINKTYDEIKELELVPYKSVVKKADFVMTAHIQYPKIETGTYTSKETGEKINLPATLSKKILSGILRKDLGFEGVIVTDALNMGAISKNFNQLDVAKLAINAGANMLLMPVDLASTASLNNFDNYINDIVKAINSGEISLDAVNDSVTRILKTKAKYGLLNDEYKKLNKISRITPSVELAQSTVGCKANHDVEWDIALKAVTSVKNDNAFPISSDKKVVIFYPYNGQGELPAKFAINKLNENGAQFKESNVTSIRFNKNDNVNNANIEQAISTADEVICISSLYNDNDDVWIKAFVSNVVEKTHEKEKKAVVLSAQLPYDTALYPKADGIVACYSARGMVEYPTYKVDTKQYGANIPAALYVLFGGADAKGKMPVKIK